MAGDKVLLKQQQLNKWTTPFESQPYELIGKCGNSVLVESPEGAQYKRNTAHVKLYHEREKKLRGSFREEQPVLLKLINNSCIHKPIRIRQFGQVRVV